MGPFNEITREGKLIRKIALNCSP